MLQFEAKTRFPRYLLRSWSQQSPLLAPLSCPAHVWHARHPGWGMRCKNHRLAIPAQL